MQKLQQLASDAAERVRRIGETPVHQLSDDDLLERIFYVRRDLDRLTMDLLADPLPEVATEIERRILVKARELGQALWAREV